MCCRLSLQLLLVGCILAYSTAFNRLKRARGDVRPLAKAQDDDGPFKLIRLHRDLTDDETQEFPGNGDEELSRKKRPKPKPEDLPIDIRPLKKASDPDAAFEVLNDAMRDEDPSRKKRPKPKPEELPIDIRPLKKASDQDPSVEAINDEVTDEDLSRKKRPGHRIPEQEELSIEFRPSRTSYHKTPILNIIHEFKYPVISPSSGNEGELPVIDELPGVAMDIRPLKERSSPNPVGGVERHSSICGGVFHGLSGIVTSPDYPFNYPQNLRCVYKIVLDEGYTVGLDCNDFSIQPGDQNCENDFLAISDNGGELEASTKYCGDKAISAFSQSSNMTLVFQTDNTYQYRGFMCRYRALNPDGTGAEGIVHVNSTVSEHTVICTGPGDDGWAGKCGVSNKPPTRIVGGHTTNEHEFPWMVAVLKQCGKDLEHYCHICGGTVIHSQWILTGAHCLVSVPVETIALLLGDHNLYTLTPSQKFFRVEAVYVHPDFNVPSPLNNDLALAKLPQNMAFNKNIAPICIPPRSYLDLLNLLPRKIEQEYLSTSTEASRYIGGDMPSGGRHPRQGETTQVPFSHKVIHDNFDGRNISVYGWGTINDDEEVSQMLRGVSVTVLPNDECDYYYGVMTDTMMCTSGYGGHGPCQGDSGSPAMMQMVDGRWLQVGVLAFGAAYGCEVGYPSGNVLLPLYVDWIEFVTGFDFKEYY